MNEAVSGVAPFGLADFRAGMAEVQGGAPRLASGGGAFWGGPLHRSARRARNQVAGELKEPTAPRRVHFMAGPRMAVKDKIGKPALRARCRIRDGSGGPGVWHAAG